MQDPNQQDESTTATINVDIDLNEMHQSNDFLLINHLKKKHDLTNKEKWKKIKDKIYSLLPSNEEESLSDTQNALELINDMNNLPNSDDLFGDNHLKQYYITEFFYNIAKYLINNKTFKTKDYLDMSNAILEGIVLYWLKTFHEDNIKLTETVKIILDPTRSYYKLNNQEEVAASIFVIHSYFLFIISFHIIHI